MELDIQQYETKSKFVNDIVELRRFRTILYFQITIPTSLFLLFIYLYYFLTPVLSFFGINALYLLLGLIIGAAVLFTPYIFYILIKEKHYGWIVIFIFMIVLPYLFILLLFYDYILLTAWMLLPIPLFYLYCFLIKYAVDDWLSEYNWEQQLIEQRKEWEEKKKEELL